MTAFPWSYGRHITPTKSPSHVLHLGIEAFLWYGWFVTSDPLTLLHTKLLTTSVVTMAAADSPYQHLPMELRPPYHTHRLEITLLQSDTIVVFFLRLVLWRRPTYAITQKPTISRPLWPPPMPHITISHGDMAMILHPERAYRIYYKRQSSNYFSYGWFSAGGPPTHLAVNTIWRANDHSRRRCPINMLQKWKNKSTMRMMGGTAVDTTACNTSAGTNGIKMQQFTTTTRQRQRTTRTTTRIRILIVY